MLFEAVRSQERQQQQQDRKESKGCVRCDTPTQRETMQLACLAADLLGVCRTAGLFLLLDLPWGWLECCKRADSRSASTLFFRPW